MNNTIENEMNFYHARNLIQRVKFFNDDNKNSAIAILSAWDKEIIRRKISYHISDSRIKQFSQFTGNLTFDLLNNIEQIYPSYYDVYFSLSVRYLMIGKIFQEMTYWHFIYLTENTLSKVNVYPCQKLMKIWINKHYKNGEIIKNIEDIDYEEIKLRVIDYVSNHDWCKYFYRGINRPVVLFSKNP